MKSDWNGIRRDPLANSLRERGSTVRRYRTEIFIPTDRYLGLQLPASLPAGRAIVTVTVEEPDLAEAAIWPETDPDQQDIEWWDEFEDAEIDDSLDPQSRQKLR